MVKCSQIKTGGKKFLMKKKKEKKKIITLHMSPPPSCLTHILTEQYRYRSYMCSGDQNHILPVEYRTAFMVQISIHVYTKCTNRIHFYTYTITVPLDSLLQILYVKMFSVVYVYAQKNSTIFELF